MLIICRRYYLFDLIPIRSRIGNYIGFTVVCNDPTTCLIQWWFSQSAFEVKAWMNDWSPLFLKMYVYIHALNSMQG